MIGYDQLSSFYRIYDPENRNFVRTRDVRFQEDVFPLKNVVEDTWENPILPVKKSDTEVIVSVTEYMSQYLTRTKYLQSMLYI